MSDPDIFTVTVTRTETVVYQVSAASAQEAEQEYILGEAMTSDGFEDITVTPGPYDPTTYQETTP